LSASVSELEQVLAAALLDRQTEKDAAATARAALVRE
jgi:hypothetical protein